MAEAFRCTASTPWDLVTTPVIHERAYEMGEQEDGYPGGDIVTMKCPICLFHWRMELPQ